VEEEKGFVREKMAMVEDWAVAAGVATDAWTSCGDRSGTGEEAGGRGHAARGGGIGGRRRQQKEMAAGRHWR
jgi:hypothetical protein